MFEVDAYQVSVIKEQNYKKEITLITCNNKNKKRLIVKAKENR